MNIHQIMQGENTRFNAEVPYAGHLTGTNSAPFNPYYYLQYRVDDVHKIWGTSATDALALSQIIDIDYDAARLWGDYTVVEMNHDRLFLADLAKHGISGDEIRSMPMLPTTTAILNFLRRSIVKDGPLAALAYSIYLEWHSDQDAAATVELVEQNFGAEYAKGARAHLHIDERDDHIDMVMSVADAVTGEESAGKLGQLLQQFGALFRAYYTELYETTITTKTAPVFSLQVVQDF